MVVGTVNAEPATITNDEPQSPSAVSYRTLISTDTSRFASWRRLGRSSIAATISRTSRGDTISIALAHIPGAVYASLGEDLAGPRTGTNGRHPVPSIEALAETFGRLGISRGSRSSSTTRTRACTPAGSGGRCAISVMTPSPCSTAAGPSGRAKDVRPPRATNTDLPPRSQPNHALRCGSASKRSARHLGDPSMLLVDARAPERFEGRSEPIDRAAGHIPGAVNHFFKMNLADDGTMLAPGDTSSSISTAC